MWANILIAAGIIVIWGLCRYYGGRRRPRNEDFPPSRGGGPFG